jgi:hypothetical protein
MKKFAKGIQRLSQRAAEIRHAVETMPAKAAELRETVVATAGQVQQLRGELVAGAAAVRATVEAGADPAAVLREVAECADLLAEAGFVLEGADIELAPVRRVRAHLGRTGEPSAARLRALLAANAHRPVAKALLAGIVQAHDFAEKADAGALAWTELTVDLGGAGGVRIGWRSDAPEGVSAAAGATGSAERPPVFSQSTFFERRPAVEAGATSAPGAVASAAPAVVVRSGEVPAASGPAAAKPAARASALDRFKKMPDLTKRSR